MRVLLFLSALIIGLSTSLSAQMFNPVKWSFNYEDAGAKDEYNLIFSAKIDDGWAVYSQYLVGDDGPIPTEFTYDTGAHFATIGKNAESGNIETKYDKVFETELTKFKKSGIFTQKIKVSDYSKPITGYLTFMTCDDERCLPPTDVDFSFKIEPKTGAVEEVEKETPKAETKAQEALAEVKKEAAKATSAAKRSVTPIVEDAAKAVQETSVAINTAETETEAAPEEKEGIFNPVTWSWDKKDLGNGEYDLVFTAEIQEGWAVYSQYLESDDGPVATSFTFEEGDHFQTVGKNVESGNIQTKYDKVFEMNLSKFKGKGIFTQKVKVSDDSEPIVGYLEFMTCDDTRCLPPTYVDFSFAFSDAAQASAAAVGPNLSEGADGTVINQSITSLQTSHKSPLGICGDQVVQSDSLIWTFIFGFLGGLLALFTPCVFPMIPLTVSFFTPKTAGANKRAGAIKNALIYGASIIGIYVTIGLLITGLFGATALQNLSTDAIANILFTIIFIIFAFSFFGYFEITLPASWSTKSDQMADKGGLLGIFFMAFTLALVSFSCTGPIIGSALVESADSTAGPFTVMLGFSSALALPFTLFAIFPGWLNSLPNAGGWMTNLKVVLGFAEIALALKFLSIADMTMGWGILPYEVMLGAWVLIFAATTAYLFGKIRFPHDPPKPKLSNARKGFGIAFALWTLYLCTGFSVNQKTGAYNTPSILSGILPPANYNIFLDAPEADKDLKAQYASFTKCANALDCFKDYYEGLDYAKKQNKPILLDFTGHGCVNCRKTEDNIWIHNDVWNKIQNDYVLISLYTDDRKKLDQPLISATDQTKLRTVGSKWQDFQITNFQQNSQPLYVLMSADEEVLASPRGYDSDIEAYDDFLSCGLNTYKTQTERGKKGGVSMK